MERSLFVSIMLVGVLAGSTTTAADRPAPALQVRTYPVADLVVPIPSPTDRAPYVDKAFPKEFEALEQHLRRTTGADAWNENGSIQRYEKTLSLVVRQTAAVHEKIADELNRLRRELDAQVALEMHIITGPRNEIAALAAAFPGEFGQHESQQLLEQAKRSENLKHTMSPKVTLFSRQTANLNFDERAIAANATVSDDRRSVRLKMAEGPEKDLDLLGRVEFVMLHSGRSAAIYFPASSARSIIPPAGDATERLVLVTPRVLIVEEEEEQQKVVLLMVTPRGRIQEEEEELLGVPTSMP